MTQRPLWPFRRSAKKKTPIWLIAGGPGCAAPALGISRMMPRGRPSARRALPKTQEPAPSGTFFLAHRLMPGALGCVVGLWLVLSPWGAPAAQAQQPTATQRALLKQIGARYTRGVAATQKKQYRSAVQHFQAALTLAQRGARTARRPKLQKRFQRLIVTFLYTLGKTEQYGHRYVASYEYYVRCRKMAPLSKAGLESAREITALRPRIKATLRLQVEPPNPTIHSARAGASSAPSSLQGRGSSP